MSQIPGYQPQTHLGLFAGGGGGGGRAADTTLVSGDTYKDLT